MKTEKQLEIDYAKIPYNLDLLITHDAPYRTIDISEKGESLGNIPLKNAILEKKPKNHCFGHVHNSPNKYYEIIRQDEYDKVQSHLYNVSLTDDNYRPIYQPVIFKI